MKKVKLYLDCDGVILDTINKSYEMLKSLNITNEEEASIYYKTTNWDELIELSGEIDNSINKIKILSKYFDVEILTHVYSENEANSKIKYFANKLPSIKVNIVPKTVKKADFVFPINSVLVDDYNPNLEYWEEKGGIAVKFSDSGKKSKFITVTDLLDIMNVNF